LVVQIGTATETQYWIISCTPPCTSSSVTTSPSNQTVTYGAPSATFTAAASGSPAPTVQWQVNTGSGFTNIGGATNTILTISNPTVAMSGSQYRAVFTNSCTPGTAPSTAATLTVNRKTASVTPNVASKTYGGVDPALTGTLTGFLGADGVSASYSRTAGETVADSPYTISATLSPAGVLGNYDITYNTANFTINRKTASVTP